LFGGTFDPVHKGHVALARHVKKKISLDRILFIPAADPPHKQATAASFKHRVAMLECALADISDHVGISLLEAERSAPSYTVDTLLELRRRQGGQTYYFILGADSLLELHLWYRYQELPDLTNLVVVARPGIGFQEITAAIGRLPGPFTPDESQQFWRRTDGAELIYLPEPAMNVSSTSVRRQLASDRFPEELDPRVRNYIIDHQLYKKR
jgi:nicotinate-nucleotide adenylyltransferase